MAGHWRGADVSSSVNQLVAWEGEENYFGDYTSRKQRGRTAHPIHLFTHVCIDACGHRHIYLPTCKTPERKVTDAATITLCSFIAEIFTEVPFPATSSGTSLMTVAPTIWLRTGKGPEKRKGFVRVPKGQHVLLHQ